MVRRANIPRHMDEADLANDQEERFMELRLKQHARKTTTHEFAEYECMNCGAVFDTAKRRFCDPECAADWQARKEVHRRQRGE